MTRLLSLCILVSVLFSACRSHDDCEPTVTRCDGHAAQVCDADRDWVDVLDCADLSRTSGGSWTCAAVEDGTHTCLPDDTGEGSP